MSKKKLRLQIFVYLTIAVVVISVCFSLVLFILETRRSSLITRKIDMYIHAIVTHRKEVLANELYLKHKRAIGLIAEKIAVEPEIMNIRIFLPEGQLFYALKPSPDSGSGDRLPHNIRAYFNGEYQYHIDDRKTNTHSLRVYTYPLFVIDDIQGYVQIAYKMDDVKSANRLNVILFMILILSILSIWLFILSHILSKYVIKPVELLSSTMQRIEHGTLGEQVSVETENEIGDMARIFNRMSRENAVMVENLYAGNKQLNQLQNLLSNIINSMPSALIGVDTDLRVTQWNKTAWELTHISASDAKGRALSDVYPGMKRWIKTINKSMITRQIVVERKCPHTLGDRDGYEDITIYPLTTSGSGGAVIRIDDVTEKTKMEEMIIQSEKMLSIGGLAAGMAHEINNPVAGMIQNADVIHNRLHKRVDMPANRKTAEKIGIPLESIKWFMTERNIPELLDAIRQSGVRITNIVSNMLDFARKSGSVTSSYRLDIIVDKTIELARTDYDMKKKYDFKTIQIRKDYDPDLPEIPCEMSKIQQVVFNLIKNAGYAMMESQTKAPELTIQTRLDKVEEMACLIISDNGPGMDKELCDRIFEPFFTTKPAGVGTGLGLSVSYFIITETHRGKMEVESAPGKGARFIIQLPLSGPDGKNGLS